VPGVRPDTEVFGAVGEEADLRRWLTESDLEPVEIERQGVFAIFRARKPAT
jgi:hypothetical protein